MPIGQVTVTAKTGPNSQVTANVLTNVSEIVFDIDSSVLNVVSNGLLKQFELTGVTTVTTTIVGGNYAVVIS